MPDTPECYCPHCGCDITIHEDDPKLWPRHKLIETVKELRVAIEKQGAVTAMVRRALVRLLDAIVGGTEPVKIKRRKEARAAIEASK